MIFNVNQTEFQNEFQKQIWEYGIRVLPLEITLPSVDDPETRDGCTQIYNFTHELLEDMYNNPTPQKYGGNASYYIIYVIREWIRRSSFDESGLRLVFNEDFINNKKMFEKHFNLPFNYVCKFGFSCSDENEDKIISNSEYPLFLKYWHKMYQMGPKKGTDWMVYIMTCDFRHFNKNKKTTKKTIEEVLRYVPEKQFPYLMELHKHAIEKGAKFEPTVNNYRYKYENEWIYDGGVRIPLSANNAKRKDGLQLFMSAVNNQPDKDKLIRYIQNNITLCTPECRWCNNKSKRSSKIVDVFGNKKLLCVNHYTLAIEGKLDSENENINNEEVALLKRMIDLRCMYQVSVD